MKPDNRLIVRYGFLDTEYLAESSGNDAEIDRMILIYRELKKPISQSHPIMEQLRASRTMWINGMENTLL